MYRLLFYSKMYSTADIITVLVPQNSHARTTSTDILIKTPKLQLVLIVLLVLRVLPVPVALLVLLLLLKHQIRQKYLMHN